MPGSNKLRLLVVDDEEMVRENLKAFFEDEGYEVVSLETGEEAVDYVSKQHIDIGIIDMRLPGIDGDITIIRSHELQPKMKFIIYTGSVSFDQIPEELSKIGLDRRNIFHKTMMDMTVLGDAINEAMTR